MILCSTLCTCDRRKRIMLTARPTMTRLQTVSSTMTYSSWARLKPTSWTGRRVERGEEKYTRLGRVGQCGEDPGQGRKRGRK